MPSPPSSSPSSPPRCRCRSLSSTSSFFFLYLSFSSLPSSSVHPWTRKRGGERYTDHRDGLHSASRSSYGNVRRKMAVTVFCSGPLPPSLLHRTNVRLILSRATRLLPLPLSFALFPIFCEILRLRCALCGNRDRLELDSHSLRNSREIRSNFDELRLPRDESWRGANHSFALMEKR